MYYYFLSNGLSKKFIFFCINFNYQPNGTLVNNIKEDIEVNLFIFEISYTNKNERAKENVADKKVL